MVEHTKTATYFRGAEPAEKIFQLYQHDGQYLTALSDPSSPQGRRLVSHGEYDTVAEAFEKLDPASKETYRKEARSNVLPENPASSYLQALQAAGLDRSPTSQSIVADHTTGRALRNEPVYSVGGHPVIERNMTPAVVTLYMGGNMMKAGRLAQDIQNSPPERVPGVLKAAGMAPERAEEVARSPAVARLRQAHRAAL